MGGQEFGSKLLEFLRWSVAESIPESDERREPDVDPTREIYSRESLVGHGTEIFPIASRPVRPETSAVGGSKVRKKRGR